MTERAKIRETYKSKKRLPAPEITKPKGHHKGERVWYLQSRTKEEVWQKILAEDLAREKAYGRKSWRRTMWENSNKWKNKGKYYDKETAEAVLKNNLRIYKSYKWMDVDDYEYRVIHINAIKKEKLKKCTEEK